MSLHDNEAWEESGTAFGGAILDGWPASAPWPVNNLGHLWFLEHLLIYASLYAALRAIAAFDRGTPAIEPLLRRRRS